MVAAGARASARSSIALVRVAELAICGTPKTRGRRGDDESGTDASAGTGADANTDAGANMDAGTAGNGNADGSGMGLPASFGATGTLNRQPARMTLSTKMTL